MTIRGHKMLSKVNAVFHRTHTVSYLWLIHSKYGSILLRLCIWPSNMANIRGPKCIVYATIFAAINPIQRWCVYCYAVYSSRCREIYRRSKIRRRRSLQQNQVVPRRLYFVTKCTGKRKIIRLLWITVASKGNEYKTYAGDLRSNQTSAILLLLQTV